MLVDRLAFLAIATSLAAVACSSSAVEEDSDEGALGQNLACNDPDKDAPIPSNDFIGCEKMANGAVALGEDFQGIYGLCTGYITNFKPFARTKAIGCMKNLKPLVLPKDDGPDPFPGATYFDWSGLYSCGFDALHQTCASEAAVAKCSELLARPDQARWTSDPTIQPQQECQEFLSGLTKAGQDQVIKCMTESKFSASSCIEGMDANWNAKRCTSPNQTQGVQRRADSALKCDSLSPMGRSICLQFMNAMRAPIASVYSGLLSEGTGEPKPEIVYNRALKALRGTCANPAEVDTMCSSLVEKWKAKKPDVNAGGRLTRECRTLFPGLLQKSRDRLLNAGVPGDGKLSSALVSLPNPTSVAGFDSAE